MEYLLDTSILIAHLCNERGIDKVDPFLTYSSLPFIALSELYYVIWNKLGEVEANRIYGILKSWNLPIVLPDEKIILMAGRFKAIFKLGLADSYIAAISLDKNLTLITKDSDFDILKNEIKILYLHNIRD